MRNVIAAAMTVLGTLLVLSGGGIIVMRAMKPADAAGAAAGDGTTETGQPNVATRLMRTALRIPAADRLIGWGIVLLVIGAVAAGAIAFDLGANAGTR